MKILYVVSRPLEINTSSSVRNKATIMGLLSLGCIVELFTTAPDKNHKAYDSGLAVNAIRTTYVKLEGIQKAARLGRKFKFLAPVKRAAYAYLQKKEIYDNLKSIVDYTDKISLREGQYDLIISSSDPKSSHLFVEKLLKEQGKDFHGKWIQIWGDPFYGDITRSEHIDSKKLMAEESRLLQGADKIVYVSFITLKQQKKLYPDCSGKMFYSAIPYLNELNDTVRDFKQISKAELSYCGDYTASVRNIMPLYSAVSQMDKVHLTICGNTDLKLESCENITVLKRQSYSEVAKIEKHADILVHLSNLTGGQIPGKIYQYSATNKPILFILDGDVQAVKNQFAQYDRYEFALNSEASINEAIERIMKKEQSYKPVEDFSKEKIAKQIISI